MRENITMECPECSNRNYSVSKNKTSHKERLELNKFCKFCRRHTPHKETK